MSGKVMGGTSILQRTAETDIEWLLTKSAFPDNAMARDRGLRRTSLTKSQSSELEEK